MIEAVRAGQRQAYAELIGRYEASVRAVAVRILHNVHDAQDAAQETFIKAYEKLPTLRRPEKFAPWLMKIARRAALDLVRKQNRQPKMQTLDGCETASRDGQLDETSQALLAAVMKLPEQEKRAILLHHFDRHPVRDVAELTGRSVGTVTKQLSRAYNRLRKTIPEIK